MSPRPYAPMAVGFYLLALPLFVAIFLADDPAGRWTNALSGLLMLIVGAVLHRLRAR